MVTKSPYKQELASSIGIKLEYDPTKQNQVTNGETNHDKIHSNGMAVSYFEGQTPYCVSVAKAKAEELVRVLPPNGHHHLVVDSTWTGCFNERRLRVAFNKPNGNKDHIEEAVRLFKQLRGYPLMSETGLSVIDPDLKTITHYLTTLNIGNVKKNLDLNVLENLLRANHEISAGFSMSEALRYVVDPKKYISFQVRQYQPNRILSGGITNRANYELSNDSSNIGMLKRFAVGIMPKY